MAETVLITGASSGIGRELAWCFAESGSDVVLVARREDRLRELAAALEEKHGIGARVLAADLSDPDAPTDIHSRLAVSPIDVLVNNAGFGARGRFVDLPADRQMDMVQVNVSAVTQLARLFLPAMLERGRGGIINVASTAGFQPGPSMAVYYASKAYVLSFSEALHEECKDTGVTVTCLAPGPTPTEFQERASAERVLVSQMNPTPVDFVARAGFDGFRAGKALVVPGVTNRIGTMLVRFSPRAAVRKVVRFLNQKKMG